MTIEDRNIYLQRRRDYAAANRRSGKGVSAAEWQEASAVARREVYVGSGRRGMNEESDAVAYQPIGEGRGMDIVARRSAVINGGGSYVPTPKDMQNRLKATKARLMDGLSQAVSSGDPKRIAASSEAVKALGQMNISEWANDTSSDVRKGSVYTGVRSNAPAPDSQDVRDKKTFQDGDKYFVGGVLSDKSTFDTYQAVRASRESAKREKDLGEAASLPSLFKDAGKPEVPALSAYAEGVLSERSSSKTEESPSTIDLRDTFSKIDEENKRGSVSSLFLVR